jgi:transcriptional regulator with XRE-family HTH domain
VNEKIHARVARPEPLPDGAYDGEKLAQFRLMSGCSAQQVADRLRVSQSSGISWYEQNRGGRGPVSAEKAIEMMDAIDSLVKDRAALVQEGFDRSQGIFKPRIERSRARWRTAEEARAALIAQGRGSEAQG